MTQPRILARPLLLIGTVLLSGCFVFQPPIYLEPVPNQPPRIVEETAHPERRITVSQLPGCSVVFSVAVEDPDVDDALKARWYIDYDRDNNPGLYREFLLLSNGERTLRDAPATLTIPLASPSSPLTLGDHVVEVLVSDGEVVNRIPQPRPAAYVLPDGGPALHETFAVTYSWFVEVRDQGTVCP